VTIDTYRSALDAAVQEYERLGDERRAIDRRLAELAQTIGTLTRLLGLVPTVPLGLTDACRLVLRSGQPMSPTGVRDRLTAIGVDLSVYTSPLSAIHTVLKRLQKAGELRQAHSAAGRTYVWHARPTVMPVSGEAAETGRLRGLPSSEQSPKRRGKS
jgi:hypothetical protein